MFCICAKDRFNSFRFLVCAFGIGTNCKRTCREKKKESTKPGIISNRFSFERLLWVASFDMTREREREREILNVNKKFMYK